MSSVLELFLWQKISVKVIGFKENISCDFLKYFHKFFPLGFCKVSPDMILVTSITSSACVKLSALG